MRMFEDNTLTELYNTYVSKVDSSHPKIYDSVYAIQCDYQLEPEDLAEAVYFGYREGMNPFSYNAKLWMSDDNTVNQLTYNETFEFIDDEVGFETLSNYYGFDVSKVRAL